MEKLLLFCGLFCLSMIFNSCITPEVVTEQKVFAEERDLYGLRIALMPIQAQELSNSDLEVLTEEIIDGFSNCITLKEISVISVKGKLLNTWKNKYSNSDRRIGDRYIDQELFNKWEHELANYTENKELNKNILTEIENRFNVNAVFQLNVSEIKKTRPVHRKVVGATTSTVDYYIFSTSGKLLLQGSSVATQANAWSGQMIPKPLEAIESAVSDIFDKLPFRKLY